MRPPRRGMISGVLLLKSPVYQLVLSGWIVYVFVSSVHLFHHAEDVDWFFVVFSVGAEVEWLWIVEPVFEGDVGVCFELVFGVVVVFADF